MSPKLEEMFDLTSHKGWGIFLSEEVDPNIESDKSQLMRELTPYQQGFIHGRLNVLSLLSGLRDYLDIQIKQAEEKDVEVDNV